MVKYFWPIVFFDLRFSFIVFLVYTLFLSFFYLKVFFPQIVEKKFVPCFFFERDITLKEEKKYENSYINWNGEDSRSSDVTCFYSLFGNNALYLS